MSRDTTHGSKNVAAIKKTFLKDYTSRCKSLNKLKVKALFELVLPSLFRRIEAFFSNKIMSAKCDCLLTYYD